MFWSILLTAQSFREFIIRLINDRKAKQEGSSRYKKKAMWRDLQKSIKQHDESDEA